MSTCKTCKFWKRHSESDEEYLRHAPASMGACSFPRFTFHNNMGVNAEGIPDGILYFDGSGYMADVWFGENFGCIHHAL